MISPGTGQQEFRVRFACRPTTEAQIHSHVLRALHPTVESAEASGKREAKAHVRVGCCDGSYGVCVRVVGEWEPVELDLIGEGRQP